MDVYLLAMSVGIFVYFTTIIILEKATEKRQKLKRRITSITREKKNVVIKPEFNIKKPLNRMFEVFDLRIVDIVANELAAAGIPLKAEESLTIWMGLSIGLPGIALLLGARIVVALGLFIIGFCVPIFIIKFYKTKRMNLFSKQLIDALAIMCNSLKTGFSFQTAVKSVANDMTDPIKGEFERLLRESKLGISLEYSFEQMSKRTGNKDLILISNAVMIQKQIGGNLAEILENISHTIKERIRISDEIKVLTASGRTSGYVIGLLPVLILVFLMIINPSYVEEFFITPRGRTVLFISFVLEFIGFIIVRKIVTVKY